VPANHFELEYASITGAGSSVVKADSRPCVAESTSFFNDLTSSMYHSSPHSSSSVVAADGLLGQPTLRSSSSFGNHSLLDVPAGDKDLVQRPVVTLPVAEDTTEPFAAAIEPGQAAECFSGIEALSQSGAAYAAFKGITSVGSY
jgi:hypothetical protein